MDFSVAIKLEKDRTRENQRDGPGSNAMQAPSKKSELQTYYRNAGQANFELAQYNEALQHFERAIKEEGKNGYNLFNKGLAHMKLGLYEEAHQDFEKALFQYTLKDDSAS